MIYKSVMLAVAACLLPCPWLMQHSLAVPMGWLGLATLLIVRPSLTGVRGAALLALTCTAAIAAAFHWSPDAMAYAINSTFLAGLGVSAILFAIDGLRLAVPLWLAGNLCKSPYWLWLAGGLVAVAGEAIFQSVFPWRLGHFQLHWPLLAQGADLFGSGILTFIAYAFAGVIANTWWMVVELVTRQEMTGRADRRVAIWNTFAPVGVCGLAMAYGGWSMSRWNEHMASGESLRVAVVQVYPSSNESVHIAQQLTDCIADEADLVCWPESIGGTYAMQLPDLADRTNVFAHSAEPSRGLQPWIHPKCPLLFGGKSYLGNPDVQERVYVSAFLLGMNAEILGRYHKRFLMPFGEYVPLKDSVPYMDELFGQWDPITPGNAVNVLRVGKARIGSLLCYEDMVASAASTLVSGDANLLCSLADGSSFSNPHTLRQHRLLSHARAIENRRYFVRCASTGESCIIAPTGVIEQRLPMQTDCVMVGKVALLEQRTLYGRFGELTILAWVVPAIVFLTVRRLLAHGE
jgi:apolipoprotein N-acyltransferase